MRVLITGINGFAGSHLCDYILNYEQDVKIYGTIRRRSSRENIAHILDKLNLIECDLRDSHSVDYMIWEVRPDKIFHLAAQSHVPTSWKIPTETFESNIIGTLNLLEAVRHTKINPVIQIAGSSEEYGLVYLNELPVKETNQLRPLSPYAVSKVAQDLLGWQYFKSYGLRIVRTRAFNHSGARRPADFVDSGFAKQIAEIEKDKREFLEHGNLDAIRDFSDVRDIVRAYWQVTENENLYGEVINICSGNGWKIKDVLRELIRMSDKKIKTIYDKKRGRPSDVPILIGDNKLISNIWIPEHDYKSTLLDMLNFWRKRV